MELSDFRIFSIFDRYDEEQFASHVVQYLSERFYPAEAVICRERAEGDSCFFLMEGEVDVQTTMASGKVETIGHLKAGHIFGQLVLLDGGTRSATCLAATDCRVYELSRADFEALRAEGSPFAFDLVIEIGRSLARQVRQATENLSAMSEARVEDPAALRQRLENFWQGTKSRSPGASRLTTASGMFRIKDIEL